MFQCENGVVVVKSKVGSKPTHIATDEKDKESNIKSNIDLSTREDNIQPTSDEKDKEIRPIIFRDVP